jgi:hypothetical protein
MAFASIVANAYSYTHHAERVKFRRGGGEDA